MEQFTKNIELIPTRRPDEFQVRLNTPLKPCFIGRFNKASGTFTAFRSEKKHLHRSSCSLAINEQLLSELPSLRWIEILYTDSSGRVQRLATSREYLLKFGKRAAFAPNADSLSSACLKM